MQGKVHPVLTIRSVTFIAIKYQQPRLLEEYFDKVHFVASTIVEKVIGLDDEVLNYSLKSAKDHSLDKVTTGQPIIIVRDDVHHKASH